MREAPEALPEGLSTAKSSCKDICRPLKRLRPSVYTGMGYFLIQSIRLSTVVNASPVTVSAQP